MWKQPYRDAFGKYAANPEYRELLTKWQDHWKESQGYITQRDQEFASYRGRLEPIAQLIQPYEQYWASQGLSPDQGVRSIMAAYQAMNQDPQGTLLRLAQQYGVDLQSALAEQPYVPAEVRALQEQIQQMQQAAQQQQQFQINQMTHARLQEINAFQSAVDEQGAPKAPHFDRVFNSMVQLVHAGLASSIQEAYTKAVSLDTELQAEMSEQRRQAEAVTRAAEANRALGASRTVRSKGSEGAQPIRSAEQDYAAALAGH